MNFFSISKLPPKISSLKFSPFKKTYAFEIDDTGRKVLSCNGETNVHEEIQMFADECNIYNIIRRYELGDTGILHKVDSSYIDTLGQPKTLMDALNISLKCQKDFLSMKPEVKAMFNNDFNQYLKAISDGSIKDKLKSFIPEKPIEKPIEKETSVNE